MAKRKTKLKGQMQPTVFGARLREWRSVRGLSQVDAVPVLKKAAGRKVSYPLIQAIERGTRNPQYWFVVAVARAGGGDINELLRSANLPPVEEIAPASS